MRDAVLCVLPGVVVLVMAEVVMLPMWEILVGRGREKLAGDGL